MNAPNPRPDAPQTLGPLPQLQTAIGSSVAASHLLRMTAFTRLAVDELGRGPSARTIQNYVNDGVLPAVRDSEGKLLFRASDAQTAVQIYHARRARISGR
jgi:hypothetical protein